MDLRQFYLESVSAGEYYYKFYDFVKNINRTYNVFRGEEETNDYKFEVYDIEGAIEKFRYLCMPENESHMILLIKRFGINLFPKEKTTMGQFDIGIEES